MLKAETNPHDTMALALSALAWILSDDARAGRLLALTGLDGADLRARIGDPALHDAIFAFLEAHQPDLMACAESLGVPPAQLARPEPQR
ncbi:DUF3572 family protein [Aquisediminimonas profunda]|uniref:DUF3572 family protein n=1 Tax=Aquisediminimonas profunda TaxID=1550733 RepID=UPI001C6379E0|nr:DUF3572 family protein [Aquisediminimonas profunda]